MSISQYSTRSSYTNGGHSHLLIFSSSLNKRMIPAATTRINVNTRAYLLPTSVNFSISLLIDRISRLVAVQNTGLVMQ